MTLIINEDSNASYFELTNIIPDTFGYTTPLDSKINSFENLA